MNRLRFLVTFQADELLADLPQLLGVLLAPGLPRGLLLLAVAVVSERGSIGPEYSIQLKGKD